MSFNIIDLNIMFVIILLGGWFFGRFFSKIKLPSVMGMVIFGVIWSIFLTKSTPLLLAEISPFIKSLALIVILLRAGLGIRKNVLNEHGRVALLLAFLPCVVEGLALMVIINLFFGFGWLLSGLTAFMLAAVSPAVIVPSMLDLQYRGVGNKKGVPTIILAGASVDDVFAITFFSIFLKLITGTGTESNILKAIMSLPVSITIGIVSGIVIGMIFAWIFNNSKKSIVTTEKILLVIATGALLVRFGSIWNFAALLGVMTIGFILLEKAEETAHEMSRHLAAAWVFAEIFLFVLIGMSLDVSVALKAGVKGLIVVIIGLIFRSIAVWISTMRSGLTNKERVFCIIAYLPKATVQAALGGVAFSMGLAHGETILAIAVIAILFTAPLGLIGIRVFGEKLLGQQILLQEENELS